MTRVVYIIPGFGEKVSDKRYNRILTYFKKSNFKTIPITINWKYKTMSDYVEEFLLQFNQHSGEDEIYLFGFSFGAMISLIASGQINIKAQFLCSLSPYFQEDLPIIKDWWKKSIGSKRVDDFSSLSFAKLAEKVHCWTYIFAGTGEGSEVEKRAANANHLIENSSLFMISGAKHDISQDVYSNKLKEVLSRI